MYQLFPLKADALNISHCLQWDSFRVLRIKAGWCLDGVQLPDEVGVHGVGFVFVFVFVFVCTTSMLCRRGPVAR